MDVCNLVTSAESPFFRQQVEILARQGTTTATVPVPGRHEAGVDGASRSVIDYLRFYPRVLRRSLDGHDLVHANSGLTGPAALAQPTRPVVVSLWGTEVTNQYASVTKACARRCTDVIVMSPEMARIYGGDCWIVPHGVDRELFAPRDGASARRDLGWDRAVHHVLFPYPPQREIKNYPRAKRVVGMLDDRLDDPVRLKTAVDVPHERMPTYMNAADALIMTSRFEGSPNVVKEALSCNLPVVSLPVGDVRQRLQNSPASTVGKSDQALVDGLEMALVGEVDPAGREATEEVGLTRMGDRLRAIYTSVLARTGKSLAFGTGTVTIPRYEAAGDRVVNRRLPVPATDG